MSSVDSGSKIRTGKQIKFLRAAFWLGLTAFGGPQLHLPQFKKRLVDKHRFISAQDLTEINAFCSLLPGPSTTQTITAIGLKLGGPLLAILTLLFWALPGAVLMSILALSPKFLAAKHLHFMQPMVAGFLVYAVISMAPWIKRSVTNYSIFLLCGIAGFLINTPIIFPLGVLFAGVLSANFNKYELPELKLSPRKPIIWRNLLAIGAIFLFIGGTGLLLSFNQEYLNIAHPVILLENSYRIGTLSFGGGNAMAAMSYEQYVVYQHRLSAEEFNTGLGLIQALPGPNFNLAVYLNALSMKHYDYGFWGQLGGCFIGLIAIFLPGTLMLFFAFPIWDMLHHFKKIRLALDGIFAASVGFILSAALMLNSLFVKDRLSTLLIQPELHHWLDLGIFGITLLMLLSKKIPTPFIVLFSILVGWLLPL